MLKARNICVSFGSTEVLKRVDFDASPGELIGVLGPSGSGKSTLLFAISGMREPTEGIVMWQGSDLYESFEELKDEVGFVPQDDVVPTALRVERVLEYAAELRLPDEPPDVRKARVEGVLRMLDLSERRDLRVSKLSGGQRKRVSVAVELLARPTLLFADEPTSGLDPALERSLTENLKKLADDGSAIIMTTHIMTSLDLFDKLAVIVAGRLAYFGPPSQIKDYFEVTDFAHIYARLGEQKASAWAGRWKKHAG